MNDWIKILVCIETDGNPEIDVSNILEAGAGDNNYDIEDANVNEGISSYGFSLKKQ